MSFRRGVSRYVADGERVLYLDREGDPLIGNLRLQSAMALD